MNTVTCKQLSSVNSNGNTSHCSVSVALIFPDGNYPIYAKGANFVPMDAFLSRATPDFARRLLQSAVDGNQNMIRVW